MERDHRRIEQVKGKVAFMLWCETCDKMLYQAEKFDTITQLVAANTITGHLNAFSQPHIIAKISFERKLND